MIDELKHSRVNVMVSDMNDSIKFYINKLGLTLLNQWENHYAEIRAIDLTIGLHLSEKIDSGNSISIGFGVTNFDKIVKQLEEKGIQFTIEQDGWIRLAHFKDPDGNPLFLAENQ